MTMHNNYNNSIFLTILIFLISLNTFGQFVFESHNDFTIKELHNLKEYFDTTLINPRHDWDQIDSIKQNILKEGIINIEYLKSLPISPFDIKKLISIEAEICYKYVTIGLFDSAFIYAKKISNQITSSNLSSDKKIYYYSLVGYVFIKSKKFKEGINYLVQANEMTRLNPNGSNEELTEEIIYNDNMLMVANIEAGNTVKAFKYKQLIFNNIINSNLPENTKSILKAQLFNNIGDIYKKIERYDTKTKSARSI